MSKKYEKIAKEQVKDYLLSDIEMRFFQPSWLLDKYKTSRYQINKIIKELVNENFIEYVHVGGGSYRCESANESNADEECGFAPCLWGYIVKVK